MSGRYRTYRGTAGEIIRVPADTITSPPTEIAGPRRYPYAALADKLGPRRDAFAAVAARLPLYVAASGHPVFRRWVAEADHF